MNYLESSLLKDHILKSNKILLQAHQNPDGDSFGSVLAWREYIVRQLKKEVTIICPTKSLSSMDKLFGDELKDVIFEADFSSFDFKEYDLFLINDTASFLQLSNNSDFKIEEINIPLFIVDHHKTNEFGRFNRLLDITKSSNSEIVFMIMQDIGADITPSIATFLLTGILTDNVFLTILNINSSVFRSVADLIDLKGDYSRLIELNFYQEDLDSLKSASYAVNKTRVMKCGRYTISLIEMSFEELSNFGIEPVVQKGLVKDSINRVKDVDFGIVAYEIEPNLVSLSFRSRSVDVSDIAMLLGGGGHKLASGLKMRGSLNDVVEFTLNKIKGL